MDKASLWATAVERRSDCEIVVTRRFAGPVELVFAAWTRPSLLMRWWTPASFGITFISCEMNAVTGGSYRFVFGHKDFDQPMAFFGRYIEVIPPTRIVWTNEEGGPDGSVTTLTLADQGGTTLLTMVDRFPTKDAADAAMESGSASGFPEMFAQLDPLLVALAAGAALDGQVELP